MRLPKFPIEVGGPTADRRLDVPGPKWKRFEKLVADVQTRLFPGAHVECDARIRGVDSGELRQVDIAIKATVGQFQMLVAVDCKDLAVPVDVKDVEAFIGLVKDIRANKGAIVSASGFTGTAKTIGENADIDLLGLVDTGEHEWKTAASIPVLVAMRFIDTCTPMWRRHQPGSSPSIPVTASHGLVMKDDSDLAQHALELVMRRWNDGKLPSEPGVHEDICLTDGPILLQRDAQYLEVDILATIAVVEKLYFKQAPLAEVSGFKDEKTGGVIARGFKTVKFSFQFHTWPELASLKELAITPLIEFTVNRLFPSIRSGDGQSVKPSEQTPQVPENSR